MSRRELGEYYFWTHRGSNDLIFVVTSNPHSDIILTKFAGFLVAALGKKSLTTYSYSQGNRPIVINPIDWSRLISIEVQTKKWKTGRCQHFHAKFYFEKNYALGNLGSLWNEITFQKNLKEVAEYWDDRCVGRIHEVFSSEDRYRRLNTLVISNPSEILGWRDLVCPSNKNIYIMMEGYVKQLQETKKSLK